VYCERKREREISVPAGPKHADTGGLGKKRKREKERESEPTSQHQAGTRLQLCLAAVRF